MDGVGTNISVQNRQRQDSGEEETGRDGANQLLLVSATTSANNSRRPSFHIDIGEENNVVPVTLIGPDDVELTLDDIVVPPDGGWGWVIVFAAFMCNLIVDGTIFSFGIMQDEIVNSSSPIESERVSVSTVAWIGSLLFGFTLLSGPFVSSLANKFGFRAVGMAGSIISALTFIVAWAFSNTETGEANMAVMFVVYGVIGGIGFSLIYVPAVICVGFYFDKKRALATGIAICGSGCGTFLYAPLSAFLIKEFQWNNALLIQAGLLFSCLVFAALYRPLLPVRNSNAENQQEIDENEEGQTPQGTPLLMRIKRARDKDMEKWDSVTSVDENNRENGFVRNLNTVPPIKTKTRRSSATTNPNSTAAATEGRKISLPILTMPSRPSVGLNLNLAEIQEEGEPGDESKDKGYEDQDRSKRRFTGESRMSGRSNRPISTSISVKDWDESSVGGFRRRKQSVTLMLSNSALINTADMSQSRILRISNKSLLNKPLYRDDIFLTGSLQAVPEYAMSKADISASTTFTRTNVDTGVETSQEESKSTWNLGVISKMLDFSLLKSPTFLLLSISGFITLLGYSIPFIYLKGLAVNNGVNPDQATLLISIIGITNTIGRIISGGIADSPRVNSLVINNAALTISGLATGAVPLIGQFGFPGYVVYSCVFGLSMACFASLRSILLVELLGLSKLTNAFGLLLLFQGCAAMCGSPLAGSLFDLTGNYDMSFYLAGSLMLISGIMCYPLNAINKWETNINNKKLNLEEK